MNGGKEEGVEMYFGHEVLYVEIRLLSADLVVIYVSWLDCLWWK